MFRDDDTEDTVPDIGTSAKLMVMWSVRGVENVGVRWTELEMSKGNSDGICNFHCSVYDILIEYKPLISNLLFKM